MDRIAVPFLLSFFITALLTPVVIKGVKHYGLIDYPKRKHPGAIHSRPIPRGGGIALFLGTWLTAYLVLPLNKTTLILFFASLLALVVGMIDDKLNADSKEVSPYLRFFINIFCAVLVVIGGVHIGFVTNPLGGIFHVDSVKIMVLPGVLLSLADIVTVVWIIWVMNMINWSKGVDGQMPGIVAISAFIIGLLSLRFPVPGITLIDAQLSFIIAGCSLGFLVYNFYPAKILPGYGATAIYLLLAVVSILSSSKLATALLVMGVPSVDAVFTILRRLHAKTSPFRADRKHLHHILLKIGWNQRQVALFYWVISAILGIIALQLQSRSKLFALIMLVVVAGGGIVFLHRLTQREHEKDIS